MFVDFFSLHRILLGNPVRKKKSKSVDLQSLSRTVNPLFLGCVEHTVHYRKKPYFSLLIQMHIKVAEVTKFSPRCVYFQPIHYIVLMTVRVPKIGFSGTQPEKWVFKGKWNCKLQAFFSSFFVFLDLPKSKNPDFGYPIRE